MNLKIKIFQAITLTARTPLSLDESSLDGTSLSSLRPVSNPELPSVPDAMNNFFQHVAGMFHRSLIALLFVS